jgi:predicted O-methyltransferase YrrM
VKRTRHGKPIGRLRAALRELRRRTRPLRRRLRGRPDPQRIQRSVPLRSEDASHKRRRWHVLVDLIHEHGPASDAVVVDIGTFHGHSAAHVHAYCPQVAQIYTIDLNPPDPTHSRIRNAPRVEFIQSDSRAAAQHFEDTSVDLIFVDADHSESAVREDLAAWVPKVKTGGLLTGHDYGSRRHPGVKRAVDDFFAEHPHPLRVEADMVWWTIK